MKPIVFGAVLALVWLLFGSPLTLPSAGLIQVESPVTIAFAAGLLARPYLRRSRRWTA
ncbi:hypothetical protein ACFU53_15945 [Streptomyces sp. NPDC057474]|uniref:hypothetical protein n=1 Tax=Streptomyces sp. NPDC057474 TaxID=3346144 RepID=UPI0036C88350